MFTITIQESAQCIHVMLFSTHNEVKLWILSNYLRKKFQQKRNLLKNKTEIGYYKVSQSMNKNLLTMEWLEV